MKIRLGSVNFTFNFWFFAVIACFLTLDKEVLAYYCMLPVITHELGHLLVMAVLGVPISEVAFTAVSLRITRKSDRFYSYSAEIAISLAGAAANLFMAFLLYKFAFQSMRTMLLIACNVATAMFNLLPIGNLDGGQVVRLLCSRFFSLRAAAVVSRTVSLAVLSPLFGVAIFLLLGQKGNFTLLLACLYLAFIVLFRDNESF